MPEDISFASEADRILKERQDNLALERQKNAILSEDYLDHAREAMTRYDNQSAAEWASKALELDHNNAEAEGILRRSRAALGYRDAEVATLADLMSRTKRVKVEQAQYQAQKYWNDAARARKAGDYATSLENLELALTVIQNDPSGISWGRMKRDVLRQIEADTKMKEKSDATARARSAREAYRAVKEEEARRRLTEIDKRNSLFEAAMTHFELEEYEKAESALKQYLELVPGDTNAQQLLSTATRGKHQKASDDSLRLTRERFREWRLDMKETTIPYHKILTWPSQEHWDRITSLRAEAGVIEGGEDESPETAGTKNKLRSERVSFQFQGAEFTEVIRYIADTRQLNIVVDPQVAPELEAVPITLTLNDVTVEDALDTVNRIAGSLVYVVRGGVVLITKPEFARADPIVQVHSVGDLTVALTNFIAPNLQLLPAGAEEDEDNPTFGQATEGVTPFGGAEDLITPASGEDKLVVVAEPEVQRQTAAFLDDLRAFSGLVVTIETRFLTVTDNFLRDIGVDIRGLGAGTPGQLAVLDDVTNGLDDNASAGFDNFGVGLPANANASPSSGAFFNNNSDGDYRGRTENIFDQALGTAITNVGGAIVQYTLVDDTNLSLILRAVQKSQEGRVLQAPSVTVFNTQRANITLINQLTFIQDFDVEVAQTAFIADPIIGVIQDGLVLDVQPTVSHDRKYITLQLKPTIANLVRPIPTFTTSLGAFTTPVTIQIPELQVQRAATTVRVPDGGTLLLGGLKNISQQDLKSETPWISSIPFASFFFGRKGTSEEMSNLMVIVKATISDLQEQERMRRR
jgi:type II secretory pathway component GspD/PulD (secretin)